MKLLNTIQKIIQEAEEQYNNACESCVPVEELDRLEKHYNDSLKLLNTIQKIIQEAEEQYIIACESCVPVEELDRLEKHYKDSLKLLKLYRSEEKKKK